MLPRDLDARLMRFEPIDAELVPANSMLREFLGPKVMKTVRIKVIVREKFNLCLQIAGFVICFFDTNCAIMGLKKGT